MLHLPLVLLVQVVEHAPAAPPLCLLLRTNYRHVVQPHRVVYFAHHFLLRRFVFELALLLFEFEGFTDDFGFFGGGDEAGEEVFHGVGEGLLFGASVALAGVVFDDDLAFVALGVFFWMDGGVLENAFWTRVEVKCS